MVDWSSPSVVAADSAAFSKVTYCFLGISLWEILSHLDFEWSLIRGRRKFRWPLVFLFFLSRYCILLAFLGLIISTSVTTPLNCRAIYIFISWSGNMTLLCSSTSLMLRTIALWERRLIIVIPLGVLCLAFWGILYRTMFIVSASWNAEEAACVVTQTDPSLLNVTFFFTMGFDFTILVYTAIALITKHTARTDLWKLLFHDGLVYFMVTFTANCLPAVFNVLNLNTPMNVIATIPAAAVSSIASCRAVMRLLDYTSGDVYVHSMSGVAAQSSGNRSGGRGRASTSAGIPKFGATRPEVIVTTEHITMSEFPSDPDSPYGKTTSTITAGENDDGIHQHNKSYQRESSDSSSMV